MSIVVAYSLRVGLMLLQRHKLKVTELKELLARNHLVQTGKKDDLVKRLLENNIQAEDGDCDDSVSQRSNGRFQVLMVCPQEDPELDDENTEQATAQVASSSTGVSRVW